MAEYYAVLISSADPSLHPTEVADRISGALNRLPEVPDLIVSCHAPVVALDAGHEFDHFDSLLQWEPTVPYHQEDAGRYTLPVVLALLPQVDLLDYWETPVGPVVRPDLTGRFTGGGRVCVASTCDTRRPARFHVLSARGAYDGRSYCTLDAYRSDLERVDHGEGHYIVDDGAS